MTERGRATRAKLIDATLAVVGEVGYAHASTRAIAEAAGVAEGTIYRHFPDKATLFFAAAVESNAPAMAWVADLPSRAGQGTVEANLSEALRQLAVLQERIVPLELAMLADRELAAQRQRALAANQGDPPGPPEAIAAYLAAEQGLGRIRADIDPTEAAIVLLAALLGLAITPGRGPVESDSERVQAAVLLLVHGIGAGPSGDRSGGG